MRPDDRVVHLVVTSRDDSPLRAEVRAGVRSQVGVEVRVHRVFGTPRPGDRNRFETIARMRNGVRRLVAAPWVMMLDDDVVLAPDCVATLLDALRARPGFAAMGADYDGAMAGRPGGWDHPPHVGMGATLFRGERLAALTFRWEPARCECQCCCDDLRRGGWGIGLAPGARAWHRRAPAPARDGVAPEGRTGAALAPDRPRGATSLPGRVLTAFDRHHYRKFRGQFLPTLRASGNDEPVTAVVYGLAPSERRRLRADGVDVVAHADNGVSPSLRRLRGFQDALARWPDDTPVAFWDAGDVRFQGRIDPLWTLASANPGLILLVREPAGYPESPAILDWCRYVIDPEARRRVFEIMSTHPFINGGFIAGTARSLADYLVEGDRLLHSPGLRGVAHWGDQVALIVFCHDRPDRWLEVAEGWNYCLAFRPARQFRTGPDGRTVRTDGQPVPVVHGNGGSLRWQKLPVLF